ncbi:DUF3883 domain-containing protein [Maribellus sp. CM-23]|uniref:DUF3883 domain-containing protein n=1 Tax=Maribellus sp. CM-23 TaxID=2781026 RepID=UPI001F2F50B1|nr:DUF3883 domain-containing protein [Maribellus sp. CM-23]MCE4564258.1 DUF3883 domain-containing protein [Maribellus sp. CM-23]
MNDLNTFIEKELKKRREDYISSPAYILEHYNIEKQNIEAYNGRQLLEMLQNADDASEIAKEKKVLIKLDDNFLTISNNGEPFNEDGFRSIIYSNLSSKTLLQNKIGQKGLGFRSILSWADEVIISSGETKLAFSETLAKSFLENLITKSPEISSFLKQNSKVKYPIATLRVPKLLNGENIFENNFDTTISIKLKKNIIEEVQSQIFSVINKETLIFLNHIEIIEIDSPKRKITYKKNYTDKFKKEVTVKSINILQDSTETKTWKVKRRKGVHKEKNFELSIAWNDELNDTENVLFSYFKTEVRFPFPALLHGTFELTQDRNQLVNDTEGHNEFLTGELSELLIETALEISKDGEVNYLPLKILNIDFEKVDNVLQKFNFKELLIEKIKASNVFPSINEIYNSYEDNPVFYDLPVASIVKGDDVSNLMPICEDESVKSFFKTFPLFHYTLSKFISIISERVFKIEIPVLAKLICYFLEYEPYKNELNSTTLELSELDEFFIDSEMNVISWSSNIFIQPQNKIEFKLPKSLNISFLNQDLVNALLIELNIDNIETLLIKLDAFGIKNYSFIEIAETLIKHFNSIEKIEKKDVIELHTFLFQLFKNELGNNEQSTLSSDIIIPVISANKKIRHTNSLYFGKYYGNTITDQIFKYDKSKLLARPSEFGLDDFNSDDLKAYFKWLGIAELPRKIFTNAPDEFIEYAFKKYDYKNKIGDYHFNNFEKFKKSCNRYGSAKIQSIDDIDSILSKNNSETIIAWLCFDDSLYKLLENDYEPQGSFIEAHFGSDWYNRDIKGNLIRSFLKWKISKVPWLNTKSGVKQSPSLCTTSATITGEFSPLIEKPNIDYYAAILKSNKINPDKIDYLLSIVGVNKTISSFETKTLYSILNKLPEIDSEGKKAKTLYRELAVNYEEKNLDINENDYKDFILEGKVFCKKHGQFSYEKNNSVFYVDNKRYGESIINQFFTIEIERRRSQEKIEKIFGVKPLKGLKLTLANTPSLHSLNAKFEQEIESFKPYVYVFRQDLDTTGKEKSLIKDIKFKFVTDLSVLLEKEKEKSEFSLSFYEYIYLSKNKTVYIKTPTYIDDEKKLKEDVNFCSTIAEAFSALIDVDAQRQQIRELFSKSATGRDDIIRTELDDETLEKLVVAKNKLGIVNDPKIQFWTSFLKCFPTKKIHRGNFTDESLLFELKKLFPNLSDIISTSFELINYEKYNEESSLRLIVELLKKSKLTLADFNKYAYPSIELTDIYELDLKRIKEVKRKEFKQVLYTQFLNSDNDKKDFLKALLHYDSLKGNFQNQINYNVEEDLLIQLREEFKVNTLQDFNFDFEKIYSKNKNIFEAKAEELNIPKELANLFINENLEFESLLYFENEIQTLVENLKNWIPKTDEDNKGQGKRIAKKRIKIGDSDFLYEDIGDLFNQLENHEAFQTNLSKIKIKKVENGSSSGKSQTSSHPKKQKRLKQPSEELGFLGEWLVYKHLLNSIKNKESIKWVSEYAKLAGVNSDGKNGLGYDLEYIPNEAKYPRYVEVKVVGWENAFHISSNEVIQGEKLKRHYEIFLVRNIGDTDNISIEIIQGPFDYSGQRSFNDNDLFTVVNDNFILKFQKTDE